MTLYYARKKYNGKFYYYVIDPVSDKKGKQLKKEGEEVFDTRQECVKFISSK